MRVVGDTVHRGIDPRLFRILPALLDSGTTAGKGGRVFWFLSTVQLSTDKGGERRSRNSLRVRQILQLLGHSEREPVEKIRLQGLEHVLSFTIVENKIFLRSYRILLKKSNSRVPRIELEEIGPRANLICRRIKLASEDLFKEACKKPKELKIKKKKNISTDNFGTTSVVYMLEYKILILYRQER